MEYVLKSESSKGVDFTAETVLEISKEGDSMEKLGTNITTILVVEDEPLICEVCVRALTSEGFEVDTARNGKIAEDMLEEKAYDLVLIDIRTPVINGKELYEWMNEKHPEMCNNVIFTTGDVIAKDTQYFLETNGRPFIPKPFTIIELRTEIKKALENLRNDEAEKECHTHSCPK